MSLLDSLVIAMAAPQQGAPNPWLQLIPFALILGIATLRLRADYLAIVTIAAAEIVRLRFFAGLSVEETAEILDLSERTVKREWAFARAWLFAALGASER